MNLKKLILAAAAGTTLLAAAPVFAHDYGDRWSGPSHGWRGPYHRHPYYGGYYRARGYYMPPPPVYYTPPAPVYYAPPEPYYYAPRTPVIYGRVPLGRHSSIGFSLPLD
jgi:hypothetical protein